MSLSNHKLLKQLFALIIYDLMGSLASQTNEPKNQDTKDSWWKRGETIKREGYWKKKQLV